MWRMMPSQCPDHLSRWGAIGFLGSYRDRPISNELIGLLKFRLVEDESLVAVVPKGELLNKI